MRQFRYIVCYDVNSHDSWTTDLVDNIVGEQSWDIARAECCNLSSSIQNGRI